MLCFFSSLSFYILLTEALKTTWMEKLSWVHINTSILSDFQVVLMDIVYQVISVSLFKIHKTKCTPTDSKVNQIIYIQFFPKCPKQVQHLQNMTSALLALSFSFFIRLEIIFERKKRVYCGHFYFNKIASYSVLCRIWKVNEENNFKGTR